MIDKLKTYYKQGKSFYKQNSNHILISLFVSVATLFITAVATSDKSFFFYLAIGYTFLALFFFQQYKTVFDQRFSKANQILFDYFGWAARTNDYYRRKQHFVDEKQLLARTLVKECIPKLLKNETDQKNNIKNINIFLDAGTTIAEMFPLIASKGIDILTSVSINIYTNNLAGIIELHRKGEPQSYKLKEDNIHLLGGQPLYDYQAVTGQATDKAIKSFCNESQCSEKTEKDTITIGIITANWIMAGVGMNEIVLCARGNGHLSIKQTIIENADFIFIVVPLAKIIRTHDLDFLNKIRPYDDKYEKYTIEACKRETTFLVTTKRTIAPLNTTTMAFSSCISEGNNKNYTLSEFCPESTIDGNKENVELEEFPQKYIREYKHELYNINK